MMRAQPGSPAKICSDILLWLVSTLLALAGLVIVIVAILIFNVCDSIWDSKAYQALRAWWFGPARRRPQGEDGRRS